MVMLVSTLTPHLVTRDPAAAAAWYGSVLGAVETSRITLPGGQVLTTIELRFGDTMLAIADEFPEMGVVSPLTRWAVDQHLRDVPADEVARLAAAAFGGGAES
jgi:PhnB protein